VEMSDSVADLAEKSDALMDPSLALLSAHASDL